jgi:hypothetical protein
VRAHFKHPCFNIFSMIQGISPFNGFSPMQILSKNPGVHQNSNSQSGSSFENVRVHSLTFSYTPGSMSVTPRLPSWPAPLQTLALVASPRLGLRHFWCVDEPHVNTDLQDSPRPKLVGSHHLLPHSIIFCLATRRAPKCHFVSRLPSWSPKFSQLGTPTTLGAHNFVCRPPIEVKFKAKL